MCDQPYKATNTKRRQKQFATNTKATNPLCDNHCKATNHINDIDIVNYHHSTGCEAPNISLCQVCWHRTRDGVPLKLAASEAIAKSLVLFDRQTKTPLTCHESHWAAQFAPCEAVNSLVKLSMYCQQAHVWSCQQSYEVANSFMKLPTVSLGWHTSQ